MVSAINSNGFTLASSNSNWNLSNATGNNYVGWQWQAGQGTTSNITVGQYSTSPNVPSIASTVSVNATAGFSVVTYTGNGSGGATIGHGLGVAPSMIIVKRRDNGSGGTNWFVYNKYLNNGTNPAQYYLLLQSTNGQGGASNVWNDTAPTSTVFSVGTSVETNGSGGTLVAYCWTPIAGYSAFGSYTGNGSADGPFVYLGFKPRFIMAKPSSTTGEWTMWDSSRDTYNVGDKRLVANDTASEYNNGNGLIDFLSNGFKPRVNHISNNSSGATYIYMAFAENPFKNSLAR
jgi:hypothetical protein